MDATLKLWVVIFAVGLLNYLSRLSFIAVFARRSMPRYWIRSDPVTSYACICSHSNERMIFSGAR